MARATNPELTKRINKALVLLKKHPSPGQVATLLEECFGVSIRQSYRYIQHAQKITDILPLPEQKIVFTVKVPKGLLHRLREAAKFQGTTLSHTVTIALEDFLKRESYGEE